MTDHEWSKLLDKCADNKTPVCPHCKLKRACVAQKETKHA